MVCFRYIIVNTLHKGDNKDDDDDHHHYHHHHQKCHVITHNALIIWEQERNLKFLPDKYFGHLKWNSDLLLSLCVLFLLGKGRQGHPHLSLGVASIVNPESHFYRPCIHKFFRGQCKSVPVQAYYRPRGFQEVQGPRFHDSLHMKVVRLSNLCTDHLYHPGNIPGTHFC
jgi:hypothetical protein